MKKLLSLLSVVALVTSLTPSLVFAAAHTWGQISTIEPTPNSINAIGSDDDGSNLIVGAGSGRLYTSSDGGATWIERQPDGDTNYNWSGVASDSDGSNLIAARGDALYTSSDSGATWTERNPSVLESPNWRHVASDADGSNLIVADIFNGSIYISTDSGANWTKRDPDITNPDFPYDGVASDADGSNLIAVSGPLGVFTSSNGGANWTERAPTGNAVDGGWRSAASDADGSSLVVSGDSGYLYTSSNSGANWTLREPEGPSNTNWVWVDMGSDGSAIIAGPGNGNTGSPYTSADGGATWFEEEPNNELETGWIVTSDADGSHLLVVALNDSPDSIYRAPDSIAPAMTSRDPVDDSTEVVLSPQFTLSFNEDVATSTGDITLHLASDDSTAETLSIASTSVSIDGNALSFTFATRLERETDYYILIDEGAIEDMYGNSFAGIDDETTWNFTTIPPFAITSFDPEDDEDNVSANKTDYTVHFNESVFLGSGFFTLKKASDDSTVQTFDVSDEEQVSLSDTALYLDLTPPLEYGTDYYILLDAGAIEDEGGNPFTGINDETTWNFTTEDEPPPLAFEFERVSLDEAGEQVFDPNQNPAISADGRYIAFESGSDGIVSGDENGAADIFVYDRTLDVVEMVSMTDGGDEGDANSQKPAISEDGRYVAFRSIATNLVADDTNDAFDVFVYDRTLDVIERVSVGTSTESNGGSFDPSISDDGRYVAFYSDATNLVEGDTNGVSDAFVYDRTLDSMQRVSLSSAAEENIENVFSVVISNDGTIAFFVTSGLLTPETTDGYAHIFAYNLGTDEVELIDVTTGGIEANGDANAVFAVSDDGRYIVFRSSADNLVGGDANGFEDVFIRDRVGNTLERIGDDVEYPSGVGISGDGRYVAFARSIDEGDGTLNGLYRYDRNTDTTIFLSEGAEGDGEIGFSDRFALSEDGSVFTFASNATNLVADDTNGSSDVFVYEEIEEEEAPAEEEEDDSSGGGSSHRRTGIERSSSDEDSDIESLTQRIEELKSILAGLLGGSSSVDDFIFTRDLDLNSVGDDVRQLQLFLVAQNKGPAAQALAANGTTTFFGPLTQAALAEFQAAVGITPAVGFFGPVTRVYVNSL